MNRQEWKREWRRQRIERRELQSTRSEDADDHFTKDLPWHDDPQGYEQGLSAIIKLIGIGILLVVAAIGIGMVWGFEIVLKGILILASIAVGLSLFFVVKDPTASWYYRAYFAILLFVAAALIVGNFWGWETTLAIVLVIAFFIIVGYSRPPWPF